jgi:hypothetical protein
MRSNSIKGIFLFITLISICKSSDAQNIFPENGNVGIGTNNPFSKLHVRDGQHTGTISLGNETYPALISSSALSGEFRIDTYSLTTLKETENHIKEKGHLPGIPSAEEVKVNGIDLGEMNAKLLQKIEELTLHLIRLEKDNAVQAELNKKQQRDIRILKSKVMRQ